MIYLTAVIFLSGLLYIYYVENFREGLVKLRDHAFADGEDIEFPKVTVIIAARNEEDHIDRTVWSVLDQAYPEGRLTVIAVNDRSKDTTGDILDSLSKLNRNLKVIHITDVSPDVSPKKNAILTAVRSTEDEFIVTTDADCVHDRNWLRSLVMPVIEEPEKNIGVVAGLTVFEKKYGSLFERAWQNMQNIDYISHSLIAAGSIGNGRAFTANGSNLLIRRSLYLMENNIKSEVASGDDFFIIQAAVEQNYSLRFIFNRESVVKSVPVSTIPDLIDQRARWASKAPHSSDFVLYFAVNTFIFYAGLLAAFILTVFQQYDIKVFALLYMMKFIPETIFLAYGFGKAGLNFKIRYYLVLQIFHIPFNLYAGLKGKFFGFRWKGVRYRF